jgi:hypothetical protein
MSQRPHSLAVLEAEQFRAVALLVHERTVLALELWLRAPAAWYTCLR